MATLTLQLKRKWFDMIKSGVKLEEYREIKDFYKQRFGLDSWVYTSKKATKEVIELCLDCQAELYKKELEDK